VAPAPLPVPRVAPTSTPAPRAAPAPQSAPRTAPTSTLAPHAAPASTRSPDVQACATRSPDVHAHATRGPSALAMRGIARAICGTDVAARIFIRTTHGLGFTLRPTPLVYQRRHPAPTPDRRSTTPSLWLVNHTQHTQRSPACCRGYQARGLSTTLCHRCSPDTVSGTDLCP
jgi:hypothetical protein